MVATKFLEHIPFPKSETGQRESHEDGIEWVFSSLLLYLIFCALQISWHSSLSYHDYHYVI